MKPTQLDIAVIGAGPVGLALALHASRVLPHARISLFDSRDADKDVGGDPRTLALSLGSVQLLQRLGVWPDDVAQPIHEVHVSQAPPTLPSAGPAGSAGGAHSRRRGRRADARRGAALWPAGGAAAAGLVAGGAAVAPAAGQPLRQRR